MRMQERTGCIQGREVRRSGLLSRSVCMRMGWEGGRGSRETRGVGSRREGVGAEEKVWEQERG